MKKIKKTLRFAGRLILVVMISLAIIIFLAPETASENLPLSEIYALAENADVIIIFNSGGWGMTPPKAAQDFVSIIEGIQETVKSMGSSTVVIPYARTKNTFLGKAFGLKDFLRRFEFSSRNLADEIEILAQNMPDKKIVITGLSFGGSLAKETMMKIPQGLQVYAIAAGIPFWHKTDVSSENLLQLNNEGGDSLVEGDIWLLIQAWLEAPFKWLDSKTNGQNLSFTQAIQAPGHKYLWHSPTVGPKIVNFLEDKLPNK